MTSKTVMQSAVSQWETLQKMNEAAREVLPDDECFIIDRTTRSGAERTLHRLDEERARRCRSTPTPTPDMEEEPTETRRVREVLEARAAGE